MIAADSPRLRKLKEAYWELHACIHRNFSLIDLWDIALRIVGIQVEQHWTRVVMDRETLRLVKELRHGELRTLEISGSRWKSLCVFRDYKSASYPGYDVCAAPLDETFDLIIAEQVWEHLTRPYQACKNVHAMLASGGHFLLTTPFLIRVHGAPIDCSRWTELGLRYLLAECGFPFEKIRTGSWGNRACLKANLKRWIQYRPWLHSLHNETDCPVMVWALAQKDYATPSGVAPRSPT